MAGPRITLRERDFSTRNTGTSSIIAAIVLAAKKGPLGPRPVSSDSELLRAYTLNEKVEIGDDQGFYSAIEFLKQGDQLWVNRAQNGATYSGVALKSRDASSVNFSLLTGLLDPTAYDFDSIPDVAGVKHISRLAVVDASGLDGAFFETYDKDGSVAWVFDVDNTGTAIPAAAQTRDRVVVITTIVASDSDADVASKLALAMASDNEIESAVVENSTEVVFVDAVAGARQAATAQTSGFTVSTETQGVNVVNSDDEAAMIYQIDPGAWGKSFGIKVYNSVDNPDKVGEPGASLIEVFSQDNQNVPVESWLVSRNPAKLDADGNSIYIETVLEASAYIRAIVNPVVSASIELLPQTTYLALGGGEDGLAVTDSEMIAALEAFGNTKEVSITAVMDGGNATPAYQTAIAQLCESRGDCKGFLSVPYVSSLSLTAARDWRRNQLGISSSFVEPYLPHQRIFDKFNNREIEISADGIAAARWAAVTRLGFQWETISGKKRGQVLVLGLSKVFNEAEVIALNSEGLNPIISEPGQGFFIFGNRTLLSRPSKLQSAHVRSLLVYMRPRIKEIASTFQYDANDEITRSTFADLVSRVMEEIQSGRGIEGFAVQCDEDNNPPAIRNQQKLVLTVVFAPINVAEEIEITLALSNAGAVDITISNV